MSSHSNPADFYTEQDLQDAYDSYREQRADESDSVHPALRDIADSAFIDEHLGGRSSSIIHPGELDDGDDLEELFEESDDPWAELYARD